MAGSELLLTTDAVTYTTVKYETHDANVQLVQMIRMLLMTKPGDILGAPDFGVDLEAMVFTLRLDGQKMKRDIEEKISMFIPAARDYTVGVEVGFTRGVVRDECLIDIMINEQKQFGIYLR